MRVRIPSPGPSTKFDKSFVACYNHNMKQCKIDGCDSTDLATRSAMCKPHHREYTRQHYLDNKQAYLDKATRNRIATRERNRGTIVTYLRANGCVDCGNDDIEVLQFDHRNREDKFANIAEMMSGSHIALLNEIAKCDVRCANCHVKRTRRQMGWWYLREDGTTTNEQPRVEVHEDGTITQNW